MSETSDQGPVDELLATAEVIVIVGPGGVGKTTTAAALGARAAIHHDRRVQVITIDPARRLAQALGVDELMEEEILVPTPSGRFWASMVNMSRSWDRLVERHAPTAEVRDDLLANPLYRSLTTRFVQSHDYIALDHLVDQSDDDRFDLVIIDTPPSVHALDVLDAPAKMEDFFGSRLLTWLTAPYRSRLSQIAAAPFLSIAERLLGGPFLADIADFFWLFSQLQKSFADRTRLVQERLFAPTTKYVVVQTPETGPAEQASILLAELQRRAHQPSLSVINRALPPAVAKLTPKDLGLVEDPELRRRVEDLRRRAQTAAHGPAGIPVVEVPDSPTALNSVIELARLVH
ncbi:MAG: AAA family ATPase [Acidimicrobiales bacterium]|nr:AAA family ATPase [Acidimicrobiales bacterium]